MNLLYLDCSARGAASTSRALGDHILAALRGRHPHLQVTMRRLGIDLLPMASTAYAQSLVTRPDQLSTELRDAQALSDVLIAELAASEIVLLASPVHNYTVPAPLKAWIDYIIRLGTTCASTAEGKIGLLADRPVIVAATAGGSVFEADALQPDFFTPYLRAVFATVGLRDVRFVTLDRMVMRENAREDIASRTAEWIATELATERLPRRRPAELAT